MGKRLVMAEDSITPPAKGDPITAAWAASLVAAVNGAHGADEEPDSLRTPDGLVSPPPCAEMMEAPPALPLPFDCRVQFEQYGSNSSVFRLYVCLPAVTEWATDAGDGWRNESYVCADGRAIAPWSGTGAQPLGTTDNAWVDYGTITRGTEYRLMLCALAVGSGGIAPSGALTTPDDVTRYWRLVLLQNPFYPIGVSARLDAAITPVCVARIYIPSAADIGNDASVCSAESLLNGCAQFRRGTVEMARKTSVDTDCGAPSNDISNSISRIGFAGNPAMKPSEVFEIYKFHEAIAETQFPNGADFLLRVNDGTGNTVKYAGGYSPNTTATLDVVTSVNFATETTTRKRLTIKNGLILDIQGI